MRMWSFSGNVYCAWVRWVSSLHHTTSLKACWCTFMCASYGRRHAAQECVDITYLHTCIPTYLQTEKIQTYKHRNIKKKTNIQTHKHTNIHNTYIHAYIHAYIHTLIHIYIDACIHTYIDAYIYGLPYEAAYVAWTSWAILRTKHLHSKLAWCVASVSNNMCVYGNGWLYPQTLAI